MFDLIITRNSLLQNLKRKYHVQRSLKNFSHESNTFNPKLPSHLFNTEFCIIFKSLWGSIISKMTRKYTGWTGVRILAGARELSLLQNITTSSSSQRDCNYSFFSFIKLGRAEILTTHIRLEPVLKISGALSLLNLCPCMAHSGTTLFYPNHLPMYISVKKSMLSGLIKVLLYSSYCLHEYCMTHYFQLYWPNYTKIMKSFNNEPHYIIFCVLLLLTTSVIQNFSW